MERNNKFQTRALDGESIFTKKVVLKWGNDFFPPAKDVETTSNQIWEKINIDLYFTFHTIYKLS